MACLDLAADQELVHYVIVRRDLPIGLQAANILHAAGESTPWRVPRGTVAVALHAASELALLELGARLLEQGIRHTPVIEEDGPHAGHLMAIGIEPTYDRDRIRKLTSHMPLVKEEIRAVA